MEEGYRKEEAKILSNAGPKVQELLKSLNTDKGRYLLENTERVIIESGIKSNIRKGLGIAENAGPKESSGERLTGDIYEKTTNLL